MPRLVHIDVASLLVLKLDRVPVVDVLDGRGLIVEVEWGKRCRSRLVRADVDRRLLLPGLGNRPVGVQLAPVLRARIARIAPVRFVRALVFLTTAEQHDATKGGKNG